jgi:hypothetical protein
MLFIQSLGRTKCVLFFLLFFFTLSIAQAQVPSYIPTNGLVGYWPFNGNANDVSGVDSVDASEGSFGSVGDWKSLDSLASSNLFLSKSLILFKP